MSKKLSIIIPVYNEEASIRTVLKKLEELDLSPWKKEIIVVDDGSRDKTAKLLKEIIPTMEEAKVLQHKKNKGKGAAVQTGMSEANGEYILIQDADLEYNPSDIPSLLAPIDKMKSQVVYGTRLNRLPNFRREERTPRFFLHYLGNRSLSLLLSLLYKHTLTDIETGYKVFPKKAVTKMKLYSRGFEFEPEITIKLLKKGYTIHEVPITTNPRGYEKGKKLRTIPDGIKALRMILSHI
jgi:dolichol-phosphate mannosyltransferase